MTGKRRHTGDLLLFLEEIFRLLTWPRKTTGGVPHDQQSAREGLENIRRNVSLSSVLSVSMQTSTAYLSSVPPALLVRDKLLGVNEGSPPLIDNGMRSLSGWLSQVLPYAVS